MQVVDERGETLFTTGFTQAIRKILAVELGVQSNQETEGGEPLEP